MKNVAGHPFATCTRTAVAALMVVLMLPVHGGAVDKPNYTLPDLEAVIIDKILDFISWPQRALSQRRIFEVVVLGETPLLFRLGRLLTGRSVQGLPVSVRGAATLDRVGSAHVLVLARDQEPKLEGILARFATTPCLTIGDTEGFAERGVAVNLFQDGGRVRFAIRRSALSKAGLQASYHLLSLARIIGDEN